MAKVAFLGLGVMGYPMAGHLKTKGHDVTVYNRTAARAVKWVEEFGGRACIEREGGREGPGVCLCLRRKRRQSACRDDRRGRRLRGHRKTGCLRRSHNRFGGRRARTRRDCESPRIWLRRCSSIRRPGRRRGRCAQRHVRRLAGRLHEGRRDHLFLRQGLPADGAFGLGPAHQNGQSDLHRRARSGVWPKASISPSARGSIPMPPPKSSARARRNPGKWTTATKP